MGNTSTWLAADLDGCVGQFKTWKNSNPPERAAVLGGADKPNFDEPLLWAAIFARGISTGTIALPPAGEAAGGGRVMLLLTDESPPAWESGWLVLQAKVVVTANAVTAEDAQRLATNPNVSDAIDEADWQDVAQDHACLFEYLAEPVGVEFIYSRTRAPARALQLAELPISVRSAIAQVVFSRRFADSEVVADDAVR